MDKKFSAQNSIDDINKKLNDLDLSAVQDTHIETTLFSEKNTGGRVGY